MMHSEAQGQHWPVIQNSPEEIQLNQSGHLVQTKVLN